MTDNTSIMTQNDALQSNSGVDTKTETFSSSSSRSSETVEPEELKSEDSPESSNSKGEAPKATEPQVISEDVSEGLERQAAQELTSEQGSEFASLEEGATLDDSAEISADAIQADQSSESPLEQQASIQREDSRTGSTQSRQPTVPSNSRWKKLAAVLQVGAVLLGGIVLHRYRLTDTRQPGLSSLPVESSQERPDSSQAKPLDETPATPQATPQAWLQAASELIDNLLEKRHEIVELQRYYQSGVREIEADIVFECHEKGIATFEQALKNKRIELGLQTIQRRQAYIKQLDQPCQWIEKGIEELQYLWRRAKIDRDLLPIVQDIDMDANLGRLNAAIQKYQPAGEKLAGVARKAELPQLNVIWENIRRDDNAAVHREAVEPEDLQSWQEICSGNLEQLAIIRQLSTDAAICISKLKVQTLFLNNLSQLSPSAARHLSEWKGDWICLNGFENLPQAVAKYLFQWQGKTISLNGLTAFSPELGKLLLTWQGRQIELMGLREQRDPAEGTGLTYLAQWERSGGKVFVPDSIREKMETLE